MTAQILLVEDEAPLRDALAAILQRAGYRVWQAAQGREALALLAGQTVDLMVTDLVMPEQEGVETIMKVRRLQPDLPIIAMSGGGQFGPEAYLRIARIVGATRLISKPFQPAALLEAIRDLLAGPVEV